MPGYVRSGSRYRYNGRLGEILDEVVFYDPASGTVEESMTPNRIPESAMEARDSAAMDLSPRAAAAQCGVPSVSWSDVVRAPIARVEAFERQHKLTGLLTGNAKTVKPRIATGRLGAIVGMNLSPHYYPNLLNVIPVGEDDGTLGFFPTNEFQAFSGDTVQAALGAVNGPDAKVRLTKQTMLNFCVGSSRACRSTCLVSTGQHAAGESHGYAKMRTTYAFLADPVLFVAVLHRQLKKFACGCDADGKDAVVRLNLLSDIPWYEVCPELIEAHAGSIYWYDYSKLPFWRSENYNRLFRGSGVARRNLLDMTFSYSGSNAAQCREALSHGYRVAAVFASSDPERKGIPGWQRTSFTEIKESGLMDEWDRVKLFGDYWTLVDGDASDYRIDDPGHGPGTTPCIVALNFKTSGTIVGEGKDEDEIRRRNTRKAKREGWSEEQLRETIDDEILQSQNFRMAKLRMSEPIGASHRVSERPSRFDWSKEKFGIKVPSTARGKEHAEAMSKAFWMDRTSDKGVFTRGVLPKDLDPYDMDMDQVIEIARAYERASKGKGGAAAGATAARALVRQMGLRSPDESDYADIGYAVPSGFGAAGPGTSVLPADAPPLAMQPIGGTSLLIGPTVPTVAND